MQAESFLPKVELFSDLSSKNLSRLAKVCKQRTYKTGEMIVQQNDEGVGLFIITSGKVAIRKTREDGTSVEIATHGAGEFFGEMSVIDGAKRTADVVALEDTGCLLLASWDFKSVMKSHPEIALEILPVVVRRFRETNDKLIGKGG